MRQISCTNKYAVRWIEELLVVMLYHLSGNLAYCLPCAEDRPPYRRVGEGEAVEKVPENLLVVVADLELLRNDGLPLVVDVRLLNVGVEDNARDDVGGKSKVRAVSARVERSRRAGRGGLDIDPVAVGEALKVRATEAAVATEDDVFEKVSNAVRRRILVDRPALNPDPECGEVAVDGNRGNAEAV